MRLIDIYSLDASVPLYTLLSERTKDQSISHKAMPSMDEHVAFINSHPYLHWYLIFVNDEDSACVGAIYLTNNREIGIGVFKSHRGMGYATAAINELREKHPGKFLANINPCNETSIKLFKKLGFHHIQETFEYES